MVETQLFANGYICFTPFYIICGTKGNLYGQQGRNKNSMGMLLQIAATPIEVCYWIESNDILYNEEYLIYDLKVIVGSIGGTLGLFLGFSLTGIVSRICRVIKANLRK